MAIEFLNSDEASNFTPRKGMVVLGHTDVGICCRRFVARFKLISHTTDELCVGFQGTGWSIPNKC
jgi:hypothetical protein